MTKDRSFKRLVRARMAKTGESFTAARANLLAAVEPLVEGEPPPFVASDDTIRRRTDRGWEEWLDLLDGWGAAEMSHREIARKVATELGIGPLVWEAQAVTTSYERARMGRVVGQREDGFTVTASRTITASPDAAFDAFAGHDRRLRERTATRPRSARYDWDGGPSRVYLLVHDKGDGRVSVHVEHVRLAGAADADAVKAAWRAALLDLKRQLEGGGRRG